jgi:hypothetical protein
MFNFSLSWDEYKKAFEPDGSWRDIYLTETEAKTWKTLLEFLLETDYPKKFFVNKSERALTTNAWQIFQDQKKNLLSLLTIDVNGVTLNCHFFDQNEIEFDFDPREVKDEQNALAIFEFMSQIGAELEKDVFLTEEDAAEDAWFIYDAASGEIIFQELERETE